MEQVGAVQGVGCRIARARVSRLEDRGRRPGVRRVAPLVADLLLDKVVERRGAARAVLVRFRLRLLVYSGREGEQSATVRGASRGEEVAGLTVDLVQDGGEELPRNVELVVADKVGVVALERVEDEGPARRANSAVSGAIAQARHNPKRGRSTHSYASGILRSEKRRLYVKSISVGTVRIARPGAFEFILR